MSDNKLKSIFDRVNRLLDERDGLMGDVADIYQEAKSAGFVPKVIRKLVQRSRMDPSKRAEEDMLMELYEAEMGAVGRAVAAVRDGATWKEAAEGNGVPRATLARAMAVSKRRSDSENDTAHDPATGEIEEETALADIAPTLPLKHAEAIGAVLDDIAAGGDGLEIPPHLDRRQRASA